ncbi:hypothetical protein B0H13DRAFT_2346885 [Mycena leptocephala]|nr:hypothetical protein B0H13DRAFT_2346885 [Mycena leptocephala]
MHHASFGSFRLPDPISSPCTSYTSASQKLLRDHYPIVNPFESRAQPDQRAQHPPRYLPFTFDSTFPILGALLAVAPAVLFSLTTFRDAVVIPDASSPVYLAP